PAIGALSTSGEWGLNDIVIRNIAVATPTTDAGAQMVVWASLLDNLGGYYTSFWPHKNFTFKNNVSRFDTPGTGVPHDEGMRAAGDFSGGSYGKTALELITDSSRDVQRNITYGAGDGYYRWVGYDFAILPLA